MRRWPWLVALACASGCGAFIDDVAASSTYRILEKSVVAARRQPDLELARAALPGGVTQLAGFALAYPAHPQFKRLHAEALCQYAIGFVFDDWEDADFADRADERARLARRLTPLLAACADAHLALLAPAWRAARRQGDDAWRRLLAGATAADAQPLRWIALADSAELALDPAGKILKVGAILATLERSSRLAPGAGDADAEIMLATLVAARGRFLPGADGAAEFARARRLGGAGNLMVDVMFARGTAVTRRDRPLFEATLNRVLDADVTQWPDRRLANELARVKARRYLAGAGKLFP